MDLSFKEDSIQCIVIHLDWYQDARARARVTRFGNQEYP